MKSFNFKKLTKSQTKIIKGGYSEIKEVVLYRSCIQLPQEPGIKIVTDSKTDVILKTEIIKIS